MEAGISAGPTPATGKAWANAGMATNNRVMRRIIVLNLCQEPNERTYYYVPQNKKVSPHLLPWFRTRKSLTSNKYFCKEY
jgi:hypothetical protein